MSASAISVANPLPQSGAAEHVSQVDDVALDERQVACADHASGGDFLHRELESGARHFALRGEQAVEIVRGAFFIARAEEQVPGDPRIG